MLGNISALDAHCHVDLLDMYESSFPGLYMDLGCAGITWAYTEEISSWKAYPAYWEQQRQLCSRLTGEGCPFFYMVGIHPRSIPADIESLSELPELLADSLKDHLKDPLCLGLGELGIDSGSAREEKILRLQLDWSVKNLPHEKRIGIHTPRKGKEQATLATLRLLEEYQGLHGRIIIDHVTPATWPLVSEAGYMAGMTLQEGKTSIDELLDFIGKNPSSVDRLMLNSDGNRRLSRPYVELVGRSDVLNGKGRRRLLVGNACRFYNLPLRGADPYAG